MFCPTCGKKVEDSKFCPYCGTSLLEPEEAAEEALREAVSEEPGQPEEVQPVPEWQPQTEWQPEPQAEQPVRFDQTSTYEYNQTYSTETPYAAKPEKAERPKKGPKKLLLWILLGAAALFLIAGAVIFLLFMKNCGASKGAVSQLLIVTRDQGVYVDDEKGELFDRSDDIIFSARLDGALVSQNNKWYRVKNGEKTKIGGSGVTIRAVDREKLSWVLYSDKRNDLYLFREGKKEDVLIHEDCNLQNVRGSENFRYVVFMTTEGKENQIIRVNTSSGEADMLYEERVPAYPAGVDSEGCVYYVGDDGCGVTDGRDEVLFEDITGLLLMKDVLLCIETDKKNNTSYYTRPLGMKGELKPLEDQIPAKLLKNFDGLNVLQVSQEYGYRSSKSTSTTMLGVRIVEYNGDLYYVDLKAGTASVLLANIYLNEVNDLRFTEDLKTAYIRAGKYLFKVSASRDGWESETLSTHCNRIKLFRRSGMVYEEEDGTAVVFDGRETVEYEDLAGYTYDFSDDLNTAAYLNDNKVMVIRKAGEKGERIARDNGGNRIAVFRGYVYYIDEDGCLNRVKPGGSAETVLEDVRNISHLEY